mmetsp:Transcript_3326/g.6339  ORF Transcript_3326/g.6339 Transcript_3326/m.6339 type:complete len:162 (+) Transcript_3326:102-587(+)
MNRSHRVPARGSGGPVAQLATELCSVVFHYLPIRPPSLTHAEQAVTAIWSGNTLLTLRLEDQRAGTLIVKLIVKLTSYQAGWLAGWLASTRSSQRPWDAQITRQPAPRACETAAPQRPEAPVLCHARDAAGTVRHSRPELAAAVPLEPQSLPFAPALSPSP